MYPKLVVFVLLAVLAVGCTHPHEPGREALEAGDLDEAHDRAERAIEVHEDDPRVQLLYAEVLAEREDFEEALPYARRAADELDERAEAPALVGDILAGLDEAPVERARSYAEARRLDPLEVSEADYLEALETVVETPLMAWEQDDKLWARRQLRELDADHPAVADETMARQRHALALARAAQGETAEAVDHLEEALEKHSEPEWSFLLGTLYLKQDRRPDALKVWESYLDDEAVGAMGSRNRYLAAGKVARLYDGPQLAADLWRARAGLEPRLEAVGRLELSQAEQPTLIALRVGRLELQSGDVDGAREAFDLVWNEQSQPSARDVLRVVEPFDRAGERDIVVEYIEDFFDRATPVRNVDPQLVRLHLEQYPDDEQGARGALERHLDFVLAGGVGSADGYEAIADMAEVLADLDRPEWGIWLLDAVRDHPDHESPYDYDGLVEFAQTIGEPEVVEEVVDELLEIDVELLTIDRNRSPDRDDFYRLVAQLYHEAGMYDEALDYARRAVDIVDGDTVETVGLLAEIHADRGKPDDAVSANKEVATDPERTDERLRYRAGVSLRRAVDRSTAAEFYDHLAEEGYAEMFGAAGEEYLEAGRPDRGLDRLERFVEAIDEGTVEVRDDEEEIFEGLIEQLETIVRGEPTEWAGGCDIGDLDVEQIRRRARRMNVELLERHLEVGDADATVYHRLSWLHLEDGTLEAALEVLESFVDAADNADEARRELVEQLGDRGSDLDARPLLVLLQREIADGSATAKLFVAEVFEDLGDERVLGVTGDEIAAYWYDGFFEATEGREVVDESGWTWAELAEELAARDFYRQAAEAWDRAEEVGEDDIDEAWRITALFEAGSVDRADRFVDELMAGETLKLDRRSATRLTGILAEYDRLDEVEEILDRYEDESGRVYRSHHRPARWQLTLAVAREDSEAVTEWFSGFRDEWRDRRAAEALEQRVRQKHSASGFDEVVRRVAYGSADADVAEKERSMSADQMMTVAESAIQRGDGETAERLLSLLQNIPRNLNSQDWRAVAQIWESVGDSSRAERAYSMAVVNSLADGAEATMAAVASRMRFFVEIGEVDEAMQWYESIRDISTDVLDLGVRHREILEEGSEDRRRVAYDGEEVVRGLVDPFVDNGTRLEQVVDAGYYDVVRDVVDRLFERDPGLGAELTREWYDRLFRVAYEEPAAELERCVEASGVQAPEVVEPLADVEVRRGDVDEAKRLLEASGSTGPDAGLQRARLLLSDGDADAGLDVLGRAVSHPEFDGDVFEEIAELDEGTGRRTVSSGESVHHEGVRQFLDNRSGDQLDAAEIEEFVGRYDHRRRARGVLIEELVDRDRHRAAMRAAEGGVGALGNADMLDEAIEISLLADRPERFVEYLNHRRALAEDSAEVDDRAARLLDEHLEDVDGPTVAAASEHLYGLSVPTVESTADHAALLGAAGRTEEAATLVRDYFERYPPTARALDEMAERLEKSDRLDVAADGLSPVAADADRVWPTTLTTLAVAEWVDGDERQAGRWIDRIDETSKRPDLRRIEVMFGLFDRGEYKAATGVADGLDRPFEALGRAAAALADGEQQEAEAALETVFDTPVDRSAVVPYLVEAAEAGGLKDRAEQLEGKLDAIR